MKAFTLEQLQDLLNIQDVKALEPYAVLANEVSLKFQGRAVILYTPLYLSNVCINGCLYCGYSAENDIHRKVLNLSEAKLEAEWIQNEGIKHLLLLSGEAEKALPFEQFCAHIEQLKPMFSSISVETYGLTLQEYEVLNQLGVTGVTLYQETYDEERYAYLHPYGPKSDYRFRVTAPERVAKAGIRQMNMGVLLGLSDHKQDILSLIRHGRAIEKSYPELELSFSLPRLILEDPQLIKELGLNLVSDFEFVKAMIALKLAFPHSGLNCSTRESFDMRRALVPLGVSKLSASVSTAVGKRGNRQTSEAGDAQFKITDESSLEKVALMLREIGYMPVTCDWHHTL